MKHLVTGAAGFIGSHVCERLLARGDEVVGVDNLNPYYDPALKRARLARLTDKPGFQFVEMDIANADATDALFRAGRFPRVIHLAAQPGVRYSVTNPHAYVTSNLVGFLHVLEGCRHHGAAHLTYASSSSVYGLNTRMPFSVHDGADHPVSLYAATKKANELMAHSYAHLYSLPVTGLRFFTVYGPWDRPDMGMYKFASAIADGRPLEVYNNGRMRRSFTYVDDIAEGVLRISDRPASPSTSWSGDSPDPSTSTAPYRLYNIGSDKSTELMDVIGALERAFGTTAEKIYLPLQAGDVPATHADIDDLARDTGYQPSTPIDTGIARYVEWYREFYGSGSPQQPTPTRA